jgi:hypothetical protein
LADNPSAHAIAAAALSEENASMLAPSAALTRTVLSDFTVGLLVYVTSADQRQVAWVPFQESRMRAAFAAPLREKEQLRNRNKTCTFSSLHLRAFSLPEAKWEAERNAGRRRGAKQHHLRLKAGL